MGKGDLTNTSSPSLALLCAVVSIFSFWLHQEPKERGSCARARPSVFDIIHKNIEMSSSSIPKVSRAVLGQEQVQERAQKRTQERAPDPHLSLIKLNQFEYSPYR